MAAGSYEYLVGIRFEAAGNLARSMERYGLMFAGLDEASKLLKFRWAELAAAGIAMWAALADGAMRYQNTLNAIAATTHNLATAHKEAGQAYGTKGANALTSAQEKTGFIEWMNRKYGGKDSSSLLAAWSKTSGALQYNMGLSAADATGTASQMAKDLRMRSLKYGTRAAQAGYIAKNMPDILGHYASAVNPTRYMENVKELLDSPFTQNMKASGLIRFAALMSGKGGEGIVKHFLELAGGKTSGKFFTELEALGYKPGAGGGLLRAMQGYFFNYHLKNPNMMWGMANRLGYRFEATHGYAHGPISGMTPAERGAFMKYAKQAAPALLGIVLAAMRGEKANAAIGAGKNLIALPSAYKNFSEMWHSLSGVWEKVSKPSLGIVTSASKYAAEGAGWLNQFLGKKNMVADGVNTLLGAGGTLAIGLGLGKLLGRVLGRGIGKAADFMLEKGMISEGSWKLVTAGSLAMRAGGMGLALGGAGFAGWQIGSFINKMIEATPWLEKLVQEGLRPLFSLIHHAFEGHFIEAITDSMKDLFANMKHVAEWMGLISKPSHQHLPIGVKPGTSWNGDHHAPLDHAANAVPMTISPGGHTAHVTINVNGAKSPHEVAKAVIAHIQAATGGQGIHTAAPLANGYAGRSGA